MVTATNPCENCGTEISAKMTAFLLDGKVLCRDCHDTLNPICPTCKGKLAARPERTSPCPMCGWPIHIVREQDLYESTLLNREEMERLSEFRKKLGILRRFGITEGKYVRTAAQIRQQTGAEPDDPTVMRRLFYRARQAAEGPEDTAQIGYAEARYLFDNGLDYFHVLKRAHLDHMKALKEQGVDGVTIDGPPTCAYCKKRQGVPLPIDRELKDPELPYPDCPNKTVAHSIVIEGEVHKVGVNKNAFCEGRYAAYHR